MDFLRRFFSTDGFMPHGMCYEWDPGIIWLNVISDGLISLAYYSIPLTLVYFVHKRKDLQFSSIFLCFALFIVSCGTTHLMEIWNIWHPVYWLAGSIKALTAAVSIVTAILLVKLVPSALALPSPGELREANHVLGERTRELGASQARLQAVLNAATKTSIISCDLQGLITVFNSGAERMLGYTAEEMVGKKTPAIFHLESEMIQREQELTAELGRPVQGFDVFGIKVRNGQPEEREWTYVRKDGSQLLVQLTVSAARDANGELISTVGVSMDITARKQAEGKLKALAQRLSLATEALQAGIWNWDVRTGDLNWDDTMHDIYGMARDLPVTYQLWTHTVVPEDLPKVEATRQKVIASKSKGSDEFRITLPNGEMRFIQSAEGVILDDAGVVTGVVGVNIDVTARKKLEQQLLQAQRVESIGTLAGGIAHDLNNILAPIMMSIRYLKDTAHDAQALDILETIGDSAKRGADIVRQVLSFARGVDGERIEIPADRLLTDLESLVKNTFPKQIHSEFSVPDGVWNISGDPTQIYQVLLNLCVNARDAMPNGGTLAVAMENCALDEQYAAMNLHAKEGRYVKITVSDTGTGIPPEIIDKVFEPFFTTKELGGGTGLGLSSAVGIVRSHGGIIKVHSELGEGATFEVYLPATAIALATPPAEVKEAALPRGNGETILLVDDEASILKTTSKALEASGYRVLTAQNGADALPIYLANQEAIAVVLTDMMMPVMDGPATIRALMRLNPAIKIIAATGLNANGTSARVAETRVKHYLTKPYTAETLLYTLHDILEEPERDHPRSMRKKQ
jgi:PAS domain S-box-containing protein